MNECVKMKKKKDLQMDINMYNDFRFANIRGEIGDIYHIEDAF
jgi:hypothetical protein